MKKIYIFFILSLTLTSCFKKDHKIVNVEINGESPSINNIIIICLEESVGYSDYHLKFVTTLKNGTKISTKCNLISTSNEPKCFDFYLGAKFTQRNTSKEQRELIAQIYKGNVSEMTITIFDKWGKDKIGSYTFYEL